MTNQNGNDNLTDGLRARAAAGADSMRADYRAAGAGGLLRNRTFQVCAGAVFAVLLLLWSLGGPPDELEFQGLRLGMPVEEAARAMLRNGLPPGGSITGYAWPDETFQRENDIFRYTQTGVREEYRVAKRAHDIAWLEAAVADGRVRDIPAYVRTIHGDEVDSTFMSTALEAYSPDDIPAFVDGWYGTFGSHPVLPEGERFGSLRAYVDSHYPDGPTYAVGGPWTGSEPLRFEEDGRLKGVGWAITPDTEGRVEILFVAPSGVDALFNAGDMSGEEFAQSFADAYGIPEMEVYTEDIDPALVHLAGRFFTTGWAYLDREHGWAVTIGENKTLTVSRVTAGDERSFD